MTNTSCDLEIAILAQAAKEVYTDGIKSDNNEDNIKKLGKNIGAGYKLTDFDDNFSSGLKYAVYQNGNNIILSFAGTEPPSTGDLVSDLQMGIGFLPDQLKDAKTIYDRLKGSNQNANITVTGHSLGGSLAQMVGAISGEKVVTFDPYGIKHLLGRLNKKYNLNLDSTSTFDNITNYKASNDLLYFYLENLKAKNNIGNTYIVPNIGNRLITHMKDFDIFACGEKIPSDIWEDMQKIQNTKYEIWAETFNQAQSAQLIVVDPILVDLDGDGIKTTTVKDGIYFDHQADGLAETSAWVNEEDGILAIDKNNNGFIDNGSEIFGDNYVKGDGSLAGSGFDALRDLDSNNDGIINSSDENFGLIKILKGDGNLISLEEAGITSINLNSTAVGSVDENGNTLISQGTFVKSDGSVGNLGDFNLVVDKMNSFAVEWLDESEEIAALPEILGSGTVYSLHQAMVRDESGVLKGLKLVA